MSDREVTADADFRKGLRRIISQTGGFPVRLKCGGAELMIVDADVFDNLVLDAQRYRNIASAEVGLSPARHDANPRQGRRSSGGSS